MLASSSFAWPVFLGNLSLGSGWPRLGSGGPPEGPDVDDYITNKLSQTITQHNWKLLLRVLFCEDIAGVLSDVALIVTSISWDSLIHCWRTGNVRLDDMMGVMTLFEDDQGGYNPPWWPEPSSCSFSVWIKGYSVDVVLQRSFGTALFDGCHSGGRCDGLCGNADSPGDDRLNVCSIQCSFGVALLDGCHSGGRCDGLTWGQSFGALWVAADSDAVGGLMAPPMNAWLRTFMFF